MTPPMQISEWKQFYGLEGAAAATLMGLLFVAVALNSDLILAGGRSHTKMRAEQAFQNYIAVLFVALMELLPHMPVNVLSVSLLTQSVVMIVYAAYRLLKTEKESVIPFNRRHHWRRMISSMLGYGLMIYGSRQVLHQDPESGFYLVGCGTILLLISATISSWELLIRVAEIRYNMSKTEPPTPSAVVSEKP